MFILKLATALFLPMFMVIGILSCSQSNLGKKDIEERDICLKNYSDDTFYRDKKHNLCHTYFGESAVIIDCKIVEPCEKHE